MSKDQVRMFRPVLESSSRALSRFVLSRATKTMSDPASASALAIPNPMPLLPPVIIDILLSKRNFSIMI
jgi:hypothetical protein